jgi:CRISPR-associated protein Cmr1
MTKLPYRVTFNAPAFLGNAEQDGQWRTPPFKALLRQWWRIAYASDCGGQPSIERMREEEGRLFGVASDRRNGSRKSQVRLRLDRWSEGEQRDWSGLDSSRVVHPEVKNREGRAVAVGAQLYLGYGPLVFERGQTALKKNAAIQSGECATLSLACPDDAVPLLKTALDLMDRYGTIGGRSRNGWGSFSLAVPDKATYLGKPGLSESLLRPWRDCLDRDWPHAIGTDARGPLVWQTTTSFSDWKGVMRQLAELKIGLRTQFPFNSGNGAPRPEYRHWLSYPVTKHAVRSWGNARLPNSLRFKVRAEPDGRLRGVILHVPCLPPADPFRPERRTVEAVWSQVHSYLDQADTLTRTPD